MNFLSVFFLFTGAYVSACLQECGHLTSGCTTEEYVSSFPSNNYLSVTSLSMMSFFLYTVTCCVLPTVWPALCTMFSARSELHFWCAGFLSSPLLTLPLSLQKQHFSFSRSFMLSLSFFVGTKDNFFYLCLVREFLFRWTKV